METKLNLWLTRDLTLFGRTMLAKSLGISQLIYSASMLSVPEPVINQTQGKLFAFLWRNKKDRIKRQALYQPLAKGGLSFPCFRTAVYAFPGLEEYCPTLMTIGRQFLIIALRSTGVFLSSLSAIMTLNTWITDFLAFTVNFSGFFIDYVVSMSPLLKEILSYGTIRRFLLTRSQYSGNLGTTKRSSLLRTC